MPDQDEPSAQDPDLQDDPELAAERLERALERIAAAAHRASAGIDIPLMPPDDTAPVSAREIAARLDALIGQLRSALEQD